MSGRSKVFLYFCGKVLFQVYFFVLHFHGLLDSCLNKDKTLPFAKGILVHFISFFEGHKGCLGTENLTFTVLFVFAPRLCLKEL